jgi:predicted DNA-binding WGR domain protein
MALTAPDTAPECLLYRVAANRRPRFYRVEIAMNLFSEVSVLREWGEAGRPGQLAVAIFTNLRDASLAADRARLAAQRRGYVRAF